MISELYAALKAIPRIVDAIELVDARIGQLSQRLQEREAKERLDEKNKLVDTIIAVAKQRRKTGDNPATPGAASGDDSVSKS